MAESWRIRLDTLLLGPLRHPRWSGDLAYAILAERRRVTRIGLAVQVVGLLLTVVSMFVVDAGTALLVGVGTSLVGGAIVTAFLAGRRYRPALAVATWALERQIESWARLDGGPLPVPAESGLSRVEGRTDDLAVFLRIGALIDLARRSEARAELETWQPTDDVGQARRARRAASLAGPDAADAAIAAARAAVAAVADPTDRAEGSALLAVVEAQLAMRAGRDPLPILVGARRGLGRIRVPLARAIAPRPPIWRRAGRFALLVLFGLGVMYAVWAVAAVVLNAIHPTLWA